jgi:transcription initiation factor TFIIIB Brf1 subunit/transcription initiation factor TFIIB
MEDAKKRRKQAGQPLHQQQQLKETLKRKLKTQKSAAEKKAAADKKAAEDAKRKSENQRTHADLMKDIDRLKAALGIDSSIIGAKCFIMRSKFKTLWKS